jgi:hypothetical protein
MPLCSLRLEPDSAPVDVLRECGLLRSATDLAPCWVVASAAGAGDPWDAAKTAMACVGRAALHVVTHDVHDALHSARVLVLPDEGASYVLEGAGAGRWSLWHPCATEISWAGASQLGRELPHICE